MFDDSGIDFTDKAYDHMYDAVDDPYFLDKEAELIYKALVKRLRVIPFGNYLKRYIYNKAELSGRYDEIPLIDYQRIIKDSFADNHTPPSFMPVSSKISALSKNWLTQQTVKRNVVLLLGFGLRMSVEDVNEFLQKVLREAGLNFKDPFEVICWYCYKNGYSYLKFQKLWEAYENSPAVSDRAETRTELPSQADFLEMMTADPEQTVRLRHTASIIRNDADLLVHVTRLKTDANVSRMSLTAQHCFHTLYDAARDIVAAMYNVTEEERHALDVEAYRAKMARNDRLYDYEKQKRIEQKVSDQYRFTRDDITPSDIEHVICAAIPIDRHGNLLSMRESRLKDHFHGKRCSRQRLTDILKGAEIDRFDLITLQFFLYSQREDEFPSAKNRYSSFISDTNDMLEKCSMGELYAANPYECFILMCLLSEDPLGTYADVWELAYEADA